MMMGWEDVYQDSVYLLKAGARTGVPKYDATPWPFADTYRPYGGCSDLWGTTWTEADINDPGFGVDFSTRLSAVGAGQVWAYVDHVRITVCYNAGLPLQITSFSVHHAGTLNILEWTADSGAGIDYFEIERSADGSIFHTVGTVKAAGHSASPVSYTFTDLLSGYYPLSLANLIYYRLKQMDYEGGYIISKSLSVRLGVELSITGIHMLKGFSEIRFYMPSAGDTAYEIVDITGRRVLSGRLGYMQEGVHSAILPAASLPEGIYYIRLQSGQKTAAGKFPAY